MRSVKIALAALFLACAFALPAGMAEAAGPVDDPPPGTIYLQDFLSQTWDAALENSNQHRQGPAPCLDVAVGVPDAVHVSGPLK